MRGMIVKSTLCMLAGAALVACGQKGALYLPTQPEAVHRATLPQTLLPVTARSVAGDQSMEQDGAPSDR